MTEKKDWSEFENAVIATQSDMTLPEVQALTGTDKLAESLKRLTVRGDFTN